MDDSNSFVNGEVLGAGTDAGLSELRGATQLVQSGFALLLRSKSAFAAAPTGRGPGDGATFGGWVLRGRGGVVNGLFCWGLGEFGGSVLRRYHVGIASVRLGGAGAADTRCGACVRKG